MFVIIKVLIRVYKCENNSVDLPYSVVDSLKNYQDVHISCFRFEYPENSPFFKPQRKSLNGKKTPLSELNVDLSECTDRLAQSSCQLLSVREVWVSITDSFPRKDIVVNSSPLLRHFFAAVLPTR